MSHLFEQNIKKWIDLEDQIKNRVEELKELREIKGTLQSQIYNHLEMSSLQNSIIQRKDSQFKFLSHKQYGTLTFSYLKQCLNEIINNSEQVDQIIEYIKKKREIKNIVELKKIN
tara:strand:- start:1040 stop:1384 length:345 start_codon:yes stop_codon:yes gene_type:complete